MADTVETPKDETPGTLPEAVAPGTEESGQSQLTPSQLAKEKELKEREEALSKRELDLKSQAKQREIQAERDRLIKETAEKVDAQGAMFNLLIKTLGTDNPELAEGMTQAQAEAETKRSAALNQEMYASAVALLEEAAVAKDSKGNVVLELDLDKDPALADMRKQWIASENFKTGHDHVGFQKAINKVRSVLHARLLEQKDLAVAEAEKRGRKAALEDADMLDMSSGSQPAPDGSNAPLSSRELIEQGLKRGKSRIFTR